MQDVSKKIDDAVNQLTRKHYERAVATDLSMDEIRMYAKIKRSSDDSLRSKAASVSSEFIKQEFLDASDERIVKRFVSLFFSNNASARFRNLTQSLLQNLLQDVPSETFDKAVSHVDNLLSISAHVFKVTLTFMLSKKHDVVVNKSAEAPGDAPLGKFAFAQKRHDVPKEDDTPVEKDLYKDIFDKINANTNLKPEHAALLVKMAKKGLYSAVFHAPDVKTVYRGMRVKRETLEEWLHQNIEDIRALSNSNIFALELMRDFVVKPKWQNALDMSWSTDESTAAGFSKRGDQTPSFSVVVAANPSDNEHKFFVGPGGFYKVQGFDTYDDESEVISVGPIKAYKISIFFEDEDAKNNASKVNSAAPQTKEEVIDDIIASLGL